VLLVNGGGVACGCVVGENKKVCASSKMTITSGLGT
jgi:hypothetical protein